MLALGALLSSVAYADSCQTIAGNTYCGAVKQVVYNNVGFSGTYDKVTSFNSDGTCSQESFSFSGSLSPLDEEVTVHFRGPIELAQFAAYSLDSSSSSAKRAVDDSVNIAARHGHHVHKREPVYVTEYVEVTKTVIAGDGQPTTVVETASQVAAGNYIQNIVSIPGADGGASAYTSYIETSSIPAGASSPAASSPAAASSSAKASGTSTSSASSSSATGDYKRVSYYDADAGSASGLVFMNNMGGSGSGVFDYTFGNSISYAGSDGVSCASSPETLSKVTVPSNKEFMIFTDTECSDGDCGYYRPGIPAYHGFDGGDKVFLMEFTMPSDGTSGFNADMPAIWLLNAQIPRTLQYGEATCSCWATGCGEFDVFEVLNSGNSYLTSHLHSGQGAASGSDAGGGGTTMYFDRPTSSSMKAAVIFSSSDKSITITALDDSTEFPSSLDASTIESWISSSSSSATTVSLSS